MRAKSDTIDYLRRAPEPFTDGVALSSLVSPLIVASVAIADATSPDRWTRRDGRYRTLRFPMTPPALCPDLALAANRGIPQWQI